MLQWTLLHKYLCVLVYFFRTNCWVKWYSLFTYSQKVLQNGRTSWHAQQQNQSPLSNLLALISSREKPVHKITVIRKLQVRSPFICLSPPIGLGSSEVVCPRLGHSMGICYLSLLGIYPLLSWWVLWFPSGKLLCSHFMQYAWNCQLRCLVFPLVGPSYTNLMLFSGNRNFQKTETRTKNSLEFYHPANIKNTLSYWFLGLQGWSIFGPGSSVLPALLWVTLPPSIFLRNYSYCFCYCYFSPS